MAGFFIAGLQGNRMIIRIPAPGNRSLNLYKQDLIIVGLVLAMLISGVTAFAVYKHNHNKFSDGATSQDLNTSGVRPTTCGGGTCHASSASLPKTPENCFSAFCMPLYEPTQCEIDQSNYYKNIRDYQTYYQTAIKDGCTPIPNPNTQNSDGYDAGYNYADEYQICDTSYSNGNSDDFNAGVQAWATDNCTDGQPN